MRENRKAELQEHVNAVNAAVKAAEEGVGEHADSDSSRDDSPVGISEPAQIDHEDDFVDEDRHTVVTVETVDVSRDGLHKREDGSDGEDDSRAAPDDSTAEPKVTANGRVGKGPRASQKPEQQPKKRKKKFRYESKAERKTTRFKEKSGGKAKAKARRGQ